MESNQMRSFMNIMEDLQAKLSGTKVIARDNSFTVYSLSEQDADIEGVEQLDDAVYANSDNEVEITDYSGNLEFTDVVKHQIVNDELDAGDALAVFEVEHIDELGAYGKFVAVGVICYPSSSEDILYFVSTDPQTHFSKQSLLRLQKRNEEAIDSRAKENINRRNSEI